MVKKKENSEESDKGKTTNYSSVNIITGIVAAIGTIFMAILIFVGYVSDLSSQLSELRMGQEQIKEKIKPIDSIERNLHAIGIKLNHEIIPTLNQLDKNPRKIKEVELVRFTNPPKFKDFHIPWITGYDDTLRFTLDVNDSDTLNRGKLVFRGSNLPEGASLDSNTGKFKWLVGFAKDSIYHVSFSVADDYGVADSIEKTILIDRNLKLAPAMISEGETSSSEYYLYKLAFGLFIKGQFHEAEKGFLKVLELFPDGKFATESIYMIGKINQELGHLKRAKEYYTLLLEKYPKHHLAIDAKTQLMDLKKMVNKQEPR